MSRSESSDIEQLTLIVSTGRTGTKAIASYFDQSFSNVTSYHEPKPSRRFRIVSNLYLCGKISKQNAAKLIFHSRRSLLENVSTPQYIESNPFMYGCIDSLKLLYPNIKVVHITRNPLSYIPSHINHGFYTGLKGMAGRHFPYWVLKPEHYKPESGLQWDGMSALERLAWLWSTVNTEINRRKEMLGENYLQVNFEDIFAPEATGLIRIAEWLGFTTNHQLLTKHSINKINKSKQQNFNFSPESKQELVDAVVKYCGDLAPYYGYDLNRHSD